MLTAPPIPDSSAPAPAVHGGLSNRTLASPIPCPQTTVASLPPLSPTDRPLLARLIGLGENYTALGAELATDAWNHLGDSRPRDLLDLYAWAERPEIAAWLERHRQTTDLQLRTVALKTLEDIAKSAPPTERRRAASTILRALDGRLGWLARSASGRPGYPAPPGRVSPSPSHRLTPSPSHSPPPPPRSTPQPSPDPAPALAAIRDALAMPQAAIALSTLHEHAAHNATPPATFAGLPIPADKAQWIDELPSVLPAGFRFPFTLSGSREVERTDTCLRKNIWLYNSAGEGFYCAFTLIRDGPDQPAPCWRLATLDILKRQSG